MKYFCLYCKYRLENISGNLIYCPKCNIYYNKHERWTIIKADTKEEVLDIIRGK